MIKTAYRWEANWKITALSLLLLPLLLRLGFWQLDRAEQKREIQRAHHAVQALPPLDTEALARVDDENIAYRKVQLTGRFDNQSVFLLDNQVYRGQVGYQLLQPFIVIAAPDGSESDGTDQGNAAKYRFIVNRGWLAGHADRRLPALPLLEGELSLQAHIHIPEGKPVLLQQDIWSDTSPRVIQSVDIDRIRSLLGGNSYPQVLRLEQHSPAALVADWPVVNTLPQKHTGYALQWFTMSFALVICWLYASVKKVSAEQEKSG